MTASLDINAVRAEFPVLGSEVYGKPLVYLDNAASAQKALAGDRAHATFLDL